jgi:hypothetical protein
MILKRGSASRPSGEGSDDDFDVLVDDEVVGRIMEVHAAAVGTPWMWTLGTATSRRARPRWRRSPRVAGGSESRGQGRLAARFRTIQV